MRATAITYKPKLHLGQKLEPNTTTSRGCTYLLGCVRVYPFRGLTQLQLGVDSVREEAKGVRGGSRIYCSCSGGELHLR